MEQNMFIRILNSEMELATGCTEPGAVALTAAEAGQALRKAGVDKAEEITVNASINIIKNAMSAGIPGTDYEGMDYAAAIGECTRALMKVHTSNYRIVGFTESASREELAALFEGARVILADALCTLCGAPPAEPRDEQALRAVLGSRLTKAQILGTIELLETYRNHCEYNVGVGPLLGGLAVELEEIL